MASKRSGFAIGIDLGATKAEIAVVDGDGRITESGRQATGSAESPGQIVDALVKHIRERILSDGNRDIIGVGIGVAGQVAPDTGVVRSAPNLGWKDFDLRARVADALDLPVVVMNDVQAISFGEWQHGAGHGTQDMVCAFVGTGIGGGVVSGGHFLTGCSGSAGEIGHIVIAYDGPPCSCGGRGCFESLAGGWAIGRRAREAVGSAGDAGKALVDAANGDVDQIDAKTVAAMADAGDPLARELVRQTGRYIGVGLTSIVNAFNPELVVLGGGVIEGMPDLIEIARQELYARALDAALEKLRIVRSALGADAGPVGLSARLRHGLREEQRSG